MAMQIVDDQTQPDLSFQLFEKIDQVSVYEMMKKQRTDNNVILAT
jgi:hypothetical protein